jgi:hypothetical protein
MVASRYRAIVQERVRLLIHIGKTSRPAHLAAEIHLHPMVGANRNRGDVYLTAKNDVQNSCDHVALRVLMDGIQIEPLCVYYTELPKSGARLD